MSDLIPYKCYVSGKGRTLVYISEAPVNFKLFMKLNGEICRYGSSWMVVKSLKLVEDDKEAIMLAKLLML